MGDVTPLNRPGQPADQFFATLDEKNRVLRLALVDAAEDFLLATLKYGVDSGVITGEQADELHRLGAGDG